MTETIKTGRGDLSGYFKGIDSAIENQINRLTTIVDHNGEMGDNDHFMFADLLRKYLPDRIGVETGFVMNSAVDSGGISYTIGGETKTAHSNMSHQIDILLVDKLHNAPLCSEHGFKVFPVEMVLGAIEVTRNLDGDKLPKDLIKLAHLRALASEDKKRYRREFYYYGEKELLPNIRPKAYLVGLNGDVGIKKVMEYVEEIQPDDLRPNIVFRCDRYLAVRERGESTVLEIKPPSVFHFFNLLRAQIQRAPVFETDIGAYLKWDEMIRRYIVDDSIQKEPLEVDAGDAPESESGY